MWWWKHSKHHLSQAQTFRILIVSPFVFNGSIIIWQKWKLKFIGELCEKYEFNFRFWVFFSLKSEIYVDEINFFVCFSSRCIYRTFKVSIGWIQVFIRSHQSHWTSMKLNRNQAKVSRSSKNAKNASAVFTNKNNLIVNLNVLCTFV